MATNYRQTLIQKFAADSDLFEFMVRHTPLLSDTFEVGSDDQQIARLAHQLFRHSGAEHLQVLKELRITRLFGTPERREESGGSVVRRQRLRACSDCPESAEGGYSWPAAFWSSDLGEGGRHQRSDEAHQPARETNFSANGTRRSCQPRSRLDTFICPEAE